MLIVGGIEPRWQRTIVSKYRWVTGASSSWRFFLRERERGDRKVKKKTNCADGGGGVYIRSRAVLSSSIDNDNLLQKDEEQ